MNREEITRMAREAGMNVVDDQYSLLPFLERFAALVAAAERNRTWTQDHWTEYERSIAAAAKAEEREACAKVCDQRATEDNWEGFYAAQCAEAIRARGETK